MKVSIVVLIALASLALFTGCGPEIQGSAARVLDNAGSVTRTGAQKLWVDPASTPTPAPDRDSNRY